jgi:hypothetical protein
VCRGVLHLFWLDHCDSHKAVTDCGLLRFETMQSVGAPNSGDHNINFNHHVNLKPKTRHSFLVQVLRMVALCFHYLLLCLCLPHTVTVNVVRLDSLSGKKASEKYRDITEHKTC